MQPSPGWRVVDIHVSFLASVVGLLHRARPAWPKLLGLGELLALADAADPNCDGCSGPT